MSTVREEGIISMLLNNKNCGFIKRVTKGADGFRTQESWYFSFAKVIDDPRSLKVGMPVTFLVDVSIPVPSKKSPTAINVEIVSAVPAIPATEVTK